MAADYDKLFRPHEGMEAPDDMAAQPFFDPSASFPPAPASANLPKPNGQTPPPTSDDLSERFVSAPPPPPPCLFCTSDRTDDENHVEHGYAWLPRITAANKLGDW